MGTLKRTYNVCRHYEVEYKEVQCRKCGQIYLACPRCPDNHLCINCDNTIRDHAPHLRSNQ